MVFAQQRIGSSRDDGKAFQFVSVGVAPVFPETCHIELGVVFELEIVRLVDPLIPFPFVEAIGRDETASFLVGGFEARFVSQSFRARVDEWGGVA